MDDFVNIDVQVNEAAIQAKIQNIINREDVKTEANRIFANIIDPWIPYDTGNLAHNITVNAEGVTYHADYAAKNYYGDDIRHKTDKHPLATAHWDDVAMQTEMDNLTSQITDMIVRKVNGQNG